MLFREAFLKRVITRIWIMTISKGPGSLKNKKDDKENQQLAEPGSSFSDLSRRDFIGGTGAAALVVANASPLKAQKLSLIHI